jgi:hypothetical protein
MVPIEQKDWTEEGRVPKSGQNHPLDSTKRLYFVVAVETSCTNRPIIEIAPAPAFDDDAGTMAIAMTLSEPT